MPYLAPSTGRRLQKKLRTSSPQIAACKGGSPVFIPVPQRVFEVAPLVPGVPSLDAKPHSSGVTRREGKEEVRIKKEEMPSAAIS
jgi:hypothetical protein